MHVSHPLIKLWLTAVYEALMQLVDWLRDTDCHCRSLKFSFVLQKWNKRNYKPVFHINRARWSCTDRAAFESFIRRRIISCHNVWKSSNVTSPFVSVNCCCLSVGHVHDMMRDSETQSKNLQLIDGSWTFFNFVHQSCQQTKYQLWKSSEHWSGESWVLFVCLFVCWWMVPPSTRI